MEDELLLLLQLRIPILRPLDHRSAQSRQERAFHTQKPPVPCRTADQAAQHIPPPFVGRHHTVGDQKRGRADMVCDQPDGHIVLLIDFVGMPCDL